MRSLFFLLLMVSQSPLIYAYNSKLPPLAIYANELNAMLGRTITLTLQDGDISIIDNVWEAELVEQTPTSLALQTGWNGTGGGEQNTLHFVLLEGGATPTVLLMNVHSHYWRQDMESFSEDQAAYHDAILALEQELIAAGADKALADNIYERDHMRSEIKSVYGYNPALTLAVWKRNKAQQWTNISAHTFPSKMTTIVTEHLPFFEFSYQQSSQENEIEGYHLKEKSYSEQGLNNNRPNWKTWFGTEDLEAISSSFNPSINGKNIELHYSKNAPIIWEWKNSSYQIKALPRKTTWLNSPCTNFNFKTEASHLFEGSIGKNNPIKMQITSRPKGDKLEISGEYWYLKHPKSKFPIEGLISSQTAQKITFYRMKKGKIRESFDCFFSNCTFQGWWQHQASKNIQPFELILIK
ncbi:hypothetical protein [Aureispira anguillae]|uniref:Uncharacterized protein n=1 Tax=Aureispira anguillae TaxID=2864201 RepID=A0A916DRE6_9BACT|nr:hypothetical protein [Aureispira anguillae]BDS10166.1 hypothetical protein AsAng_0008740 [Aureispira anguillae]